MAMSIPEKYRIWKNLPYTRVFVNFSTKGRACYLHKDNQDIFSSIYTLGYFRGGELAVVSTGQLYTMNNSSFVNILSSKHAHGSYPITEGSRKTIVLVSHWALKKDLGPVLNDFKC